MYLIYKGEAYITMLHASIHNFSETIPDKTTWEFVPLHAHYQTQQHYYNSNWFAVPNPPPPRSMLFATNV